MSNEHKKNGGSDPVTFDHPFPGYVRAYTDPEGIYGEGKTEQEAELALAWALFEDNEEHVERLEKANRASDAQLLAHEEEHRRLSKSISDATARIAELETATTHIPKGQKMDADNEAQRERQQATFEANRTARAFFDKHALGPLAAPSCFMCGETVPGAAAVHHMELPGVVGCARCQAACDAAKQQSSDGNENG